MPTVVKEVFDRFTDSGLISTSEEKYKHRARIMLPLLKHSKTLINFNTIIQCTDRLVAKWHERNEEGKRLQNTIVDDARRLVSEIMILVLFGEKSSSSSHLFNRLINAANTLVEFSYQSLFIPLQGYLFALYFKYAFSCGKYRQAKAFLRNYAHQMIDEEIESKKETAFEIGDESFLSALCSSYLSNDNNHNQQDKLSKDEVVDEVIMFILASQETPTSAISWFIYNISKHPHIQQKMKDELKLHSINRSTELTMELIDKLEYCDCVVKELLRYSPISGASIRTAVQDDSIDGVEVKKGDTIVIASSNIHHDPRYWNINPSLFCPERFLDKDKDHSPFAFLAFGNGPLMCPGQKHARLELKIIVVRLMQLVTFLDAGEKNGNTGECEQKLTCLPKTVGVYIDFDN